MKSARNLQASSDCADAPEGPGTSGGGDGPVSFTGGSPDGPGSLTGDRDLSSSSSDKKAISLIFRHKQF